MAPVHVCDQAVFSGSPPPKAGQGSLGSYVESFEISQATSYSSQSPDRVSFGSQEVVWEGHLTLGGLSLAPFPEDQKYGGHSRFLQGLVSRPGLRGSGSVGEGVRGKGSAHSPASPLMDLTLRGWWAYTVETLRKTPGP